MSLYQTFGTSKDAEQDGVRIVYGVEGDKTAPAFTICRMNQRNRAYQARMQAAIKPYKRQIDNNTIKPEVMENIVMRVFVSTVLKSWENVTDKDGNALEFTAENALKLFEDLPDLYSDLMDAASSAETFRVEELETTAKN
jgi:hypothetical protein